MIENLTYSGGAVWAAEGDAGTIVRIDPTTNEKRVYRLGHHLVGRRRRQRRRRSRRPAERAGCDGGLKGRVVRVRAEGRLPRLELARPRSDADGFQPVPGSVPLRDLREALQLPRCLRRRGTAARSRGRCRLAARLRRRAHLHVPAPARIPLLAAVERACYRRILRAGDRTRLSPRLQPGPWKLALLPDVVGAVAYHAGKSPASLGRHRATATCS